MRLIPNWRRTLLRSWAVWAGVIGGALQAAGVYLILFQGAIDDRLLFAIAIACGAGGALCSSLGVGAARVTKQKSISGDDDADQ